MLKVPASTYLGWKLEVLMLVDHESFFFITSLYFSPFLDLTKTEAILSIFFL